MRNAVIPIRCAVDRKAAPLLFCRNEGRQGQSFKMCY